MIEKIKLLTTGETVDLSVLSPDELNRLHYDEETHICERLRHTPPNSDERNILLSQLYEEINTIKSFNPEYANEYQSKLFFYKIVKKILNKIKKHNTKILTVFELGCGNCELLNLIAQEENICIYGCDLCPNLNCSNKIRLLQQDIYSALNSIEDSSVDLFIADNVCEHFFRDEADSIYALMYKKLSYEGRLFFIIPNILAGPNDISGKFLKPQSEATGTHFMEQTYCDNMKMFNKHTFKTEYLCIKLRRGSNANPIFIYNALNVMDSIKKGTEKFWGCLPVSASIKKKIFGGLGYNYYILKKQ